MVHPPSILIVDDDTAGRETLAALLQVQSYKIMLAANGAECLALAAAAPPDLILLDVMMPGMDGYEVCRRLRVTPGLSEVPIILLTALDDRESRLRGIEAGADDFISKPFDRVELRARVAAIVRLNRYRRLVHERSKFEQMVELAPNGLAVLDADGCILLANPALGRLLGVEHSSLTGTLFQRYMVEPARWDDLAALFDEPAASCRIECELLTQGRPLLPVEINAGAVQWEGARAVQLSMHDISERRRAEQQTRRQVERLDAMRLIDQAIVSSTDLATTLTVILDHALRLLQVDGGAVLLRRPGSAALEYAVVRGFARGQLRQPIVPYGEGAAGLVASQRQIFSLADLRLRPDAQSPLLVELGDYRGVPLKVGGQIEGVLELYHGQPLATDAEWDELLEAMAAQVALAIGHAQLLESMVRANDELAAAYDGTLEGWARALELRDKETEGHAQRVTELTLTLARAMGLAESELVHIRRGALLHDIGKMGIPDAILLKPGALTDAEWVVMKRHPVYAYEMLAPIAYLRPALDIPYYHHERWDGSGYPHGLRGAATPLVARIFAVVDVWDALCHDRPYRQAWSEAQVHAYFRRQAGILFDPQVVEAFVRLREPEARPIQPMVLVVDDEHAALAVLKRALSASCVVFTAASAEEALVILRREPIAVLLTDQRLTGLSGVQLLARASEVSPQTLGLLSSAYLDGDALSLALNLSNVRGFIPKPWALDELCRRVTELAEQYYTAAAPRRPRPEAT